MQDSLVKVIRQDYDSAKEARKKKDYGIDSKGGDRDFDEFFQELTDLYNAKREPKTVPWKFSSNRSLRIATSILDTMHARLLPTILNEDLLRWRPGETKDFPKVKRIEGLMKWWLFVRSQTQQFFDVWVKQTAGFGDSLTETFWDVDIQDTGKIHEEPIVDETGQPLTEADGTPAVSRTREIVFTEKTCSKAYPRSSVFLQDGSTDVQKDPVIIEEEVPFRELLNLEAQGLMINVSNLLRSAIPVGEDNDASMPEEERDRTKDIKLRNHPVKVQRWYGNFDADGDGFPEHVRVTVSLDHSIYLGGVAVRNITKSGKRPLQFTKFDNRLDRPTELDGEGILEKVKELAEEIDAIFNQLTDANTLSILRPGFYDPAGDIDAPILKLAPNKILPVSDPGRNILFPDISINITQLLEAIRLVLEFIERLTAASAFVFGKEGEFAGGSGTATRTNAIVQAAETRFDRPSQRLRRGAAEIVTQHLDLLQLNIPPGLETRIMGEKGEPVFEANELTVEGVNGQFDAYLLPDPSQGSKQLDRDLAGMFYSILLQNPIVATDPVKLYKVTADILKSWDKDPVEFLGPEPKQDDIDEPEDENTLIVQGDFGRVRAQIVENHVLHIQKHMEMLQSPSLAQMPPHLIQQVSQFTQQHIQEHQQMLQLMLAISQRASGGKGGAGLQPGTEGRDSETNQGAPNASGLEQVAGPLGAALDSKRKGESGTSPQP